MGIIAKNLAKSATIATWLGVSVLLFQNCSQVAPNAGAYFEPEQLESMAKAVAVQPGAAESCTRASDYLCEIRTYSPDVQTGTSTATECQEQACAEVLVLNFNTQENVQACRGCSPEEIRTRYDFQEFRCMNRHLRLGETLPIRGEGETLAAALLDAQARCQRLAQGND